jgi:predicted DsbA family dithiol-disulfide isomerase
MQRALKIDFVSDISCPWCAIGLSALEQAIERVGPEVRAELHFQPFELNPHMPAGGQDVGEHLAQKYGSTPEQQAAAREAIRQRGEGVGFTFRKEGRGRIYNTFDAHRLLHWADLEGAPGQQHDLKKALMVAHHGEGQSPESHDVLLAAVRAVGLDEVRAKAVLASDEFAADVREREAMYQQAGIHSVPAIIFNDRHLISGGQPVEVFERALRELSASEG